MGNERWSVSAWSQWSRSDFVSFEVIRASFERLKGNDRFGPGHVNVRLSLLGFTVSVTRYGA